MGTYLLPSATPTRLRESLELQSVVAPQRPPASRPSRLQEIADRGRRLEAALRQRVEVLEQEERRKDLLLATVGHELRNPLAALALEVRLLQDGEQDVARIHARMASNLQRLVGVSNDLLDLSRIIHGKLGLRKVPTDFGALIRSAAQGVEADVREKKQQLRLCLSQGLYVEGDPVRLAQVVSNLLANASRYTPEHGQIEVRGAREHDEVVIAVQDTGRGLRREQLESVFEPFVQNDASQGGLGIGLALVKELVELHGGAVSCQSDGPGRGCRFAVRMPVGEIGEAAPQAGPGSIRRLSRGARVLVVDDHAEFASSLAMLLGRMGAETLCACSGADAIEKARSWNPEVMLVDLALPDMTGYEVARAIRSDPRAESVLLVAVTGSSDDSSDPKDPGGGFHHRLTKPVDVERMRELLEQRALVA